MNMVTLDKNSEKFNPFPGLRPFMPEESEFFFGRESESEEIALKLAANRFVAITGASGSGKSSLLSCGLLPRLKRMSNRSDVWRFITVSPGSNSLINLAKALCESYSGPDLKQHDHQEIYRSLSGNSEGLYEALRLLSFTPEEKILLIIDQFEEIFRFGPLRTETGQGNDNYRFINLLTNALTGKPRNIYIVIALRPDCISECSSEKNFTHLINSSNFLVPAMSRENIREVIEGPVRKAGAEIDSDLVEILIDDISGYSFQLPVLQHALMRTWSRWKAIDEPQKPISYYDYDSIGTIRYAIPRHADELFDDLDDKARITCEKLFRFITGKSLDNKYNTHPSKISTLKSVIKCTHEELLYVIKKFSDKTVSILTSFHGKTLNDDSVIDLSNENLIWLWPRLKKWVDEEAESVQMYLRLSEMSAMYQQGRTGLLKQPELQLAINWRDKNKPSIGWAQRYDPAFERAMVYLRTSEKEHLEAEERKLRKQRGRLRRIKIISSVFGAVAVLTVLAMIALSIGKIATDNMLRDAEFEKARLNEQKNLTEEYAAIVLKRSVEADSNAAVAFKREQEARQQHLLSIRRVDSLRKARLMAEETARTAVGQTKEAHRLRMINLARSMALRSQQLTGQKDLQSLLAYQAYLFNSRNNGNPNDADIYMGLYNAAKQNGSNRLRSFAGHDAPIRSIAFVPGGTEFYSSGSDGKILKWDLGHKSNALQIIHDDSLITDVLAVSPEADWLACGKENAGIRMIPLKDTGEEYELTGHSGKIKSLVFSYDGKYLYSAALDGKVLKWDLAIRTSEDITTGGIKITSVDLSSHDTFLAGVSEDGKALVWNTEERTERLRIERAGRSIRAVKFNPSEEKIAVGYDDGMVELWDLASKEKITDLQAHAGEIISLRFSNKHPHMATAGTDGLVKLWDTGDLLRLPVSFSDNGGIVMALELTPDGSMIISGGEGNNYNIAGRPVFADTFAADGCSYVTRNFTPDEWLTYVGNDIEYEKTCAGADLRIRIRELQ